MDLVSELKRVTERMEILEAKLARLELAQEAKLAPTATPRPSISGTAVWEPRSSINGGNVGVRPIKSTTKPLVYESTLTTAPRARKVVPIGR